MVVEDYGCCHVNEVSMTSFWKMLLVNWKKIKAVIVLIYIDVDIER